MLTKLLFSIWMGSLSAKEKDLLKRVSLYPTIVDEAAENHSPAVIANYCYELVKEYNQFYHDHTILGETETAVQNLRLVLSAVVAKVIRKGMNLLGIEMPERM